VAAGFGEQVAAVEVAVLFITNTVAVTATAVRPTSTTAAIRFSFARARSETSGANFRLPSSSMAVTYSCSSSVGEAGGDLLAPAGQQPPVGNLPPAGNEEPEEPPAAETPDDDGGLRVGLPPILDRCLLGGR
jgi:hypothetical protein